MGCIYLKIKFGVGYDPKISLSFRYLAWGIVKQQLDVAMVDPVFSLDKVSLFRVAQFTTRSRAVWAVVFRVWRESCAAMMARLSAYATTFTPSGHAELRSGSSRKFHRVGPRTEPCGQPFVMYFRTVALHCVRVTERSVS
jgi:hypothetical protein